jgi:hypothetical protein
VDSGSESAAGSNWAVAEGMHTEVERGTADDCSLAIAEVPRRPWSSGDCYNYELDVSGTRPRIVAYDCESGVEIFNGGYSLSGDGRMLSGEVTTWTTEPPCVVSRLQRELVIAGSQVFTVHWQLDAPVADQAGTCPRTAPSDAYSCVGMVVYLMQ